jgi:hypothetical protein
MDKSKYHKTKEGKMAKKGLYYNINKRKEAGTSRSKSESTISKKSYKSLLSQEINLFYKSSYKDFLISS